MIKASLRSYISAATKIYAVARVDEWAGCPASTSSVSPGARPRCCPAARRAEFRQQRRARSAERVRSYLWAPRGGELRGMTRNLKTTRGASRARAGPPARGGGVGGGGGGGGLPLPFTPRLLVVVRAAAEKMRVLAVAWRAGSGAGVWVATTKTTSLEKQTDTKKGTSLCTKEYILKNMFYRDRSAIRKRLNRNQY